MKRILNKNPGHSQLILYQTEDGKTHLEVRFAGETVWLTLNQLAELFQRDSAGRRAAQASGRRRLFRRAAQPHSRHPFV